GGGVEGGDIMEFRGPRVQGAKCRTAQARTAQVPKSAKSQTARGPKRREVPNGAKFHSALSAEGRRLERGDGMSAPAQLLHMKGAGVGGTMAKSSGAFFFIWTLIAL